MIYFVVLQIIRNFANYEEDYDYFACDARHPRRQRTKQTKYYYYRHARQRKSPDCGGTAVSES